MKTNDKSIVLIILVPLIISLSSLSVAQADPQDNGLVVYASGPYEVWGGFKRAPGTGYDHAEYYYNIDLQEEYIKLGESTTTAMFPGGYKYYVVATHSLFHLDALRLPYGVYFQRKNLESWGNVHLPWQFHDPPRWPCDLIGSPLDYIHDDYIYGPLDGLTDDVGHPSGCGSTGERYEGFVVAEVGKEFMLTFDDGPLFGETEYIVDVLKNVKIDGVPVITGFFMVGVGCCEDSQCFCPWWEWYKNKGSVRENPDVVRTVAGAGHFIGVHTQHHPYLPGKSVEGIMLEISQCYDEIKKALNPNNPNDVNLPKIFRPPYFELSPNALTAAMRLGFRKIILGAGENRNQAADIGWPSLPPVGDVKEKAKELIESWKRDEPCVLVFHDFTYAAEDIAEIIRYLREDEGFTLIHFDPDRLPGSLPSLVHHDQNTIHQAETFTHTVSMDSTVSTAIFNVSWEGSDLDLVLYKPDGTKIDPNNAMVDPNIEYAERDTYEYYTVSAPNRGNWIMEVTGVNVPPEGEGYTIRVEADTNLALFVFTDKLDYGLNEQISIKANLVNDENSVTGASVTAKVHRPDGSVDNLTLYDDGTHGDEDPNDGFYANVYDNTSLRGSYKITISAIGELTGDQYERAYSLTVMVGSIIYSNVDFGAYAVFANRWMNQNCSEPDWCDTADLDQNGEVDIFDLAVLIEYWLEGTGG